MCDFFDPNTWDLAPRVCRIYGDDSLNVEALVDEIDYQFLIRYRWNPKVTKGKLYLRRAVSTYYPEGGRRGSATIYLHVEVMKRTGIEPPCPEHLIADHRNGNSLDCRRANLRWATKLMNNRNRFGIAATQETLL